MGMAIAKYYCSIYLLAFMCDFLWVRLPNELCDDRIGVHSPSAHKHNSDSISNAADKEIGEVDFSRATGEKKTVSSKKWNLCNA